MQTVEFTVSWGSDNILNIIANVTPGRTGHYGPTILPEDSYPADPPEVEVIDCRIVDENNPNGGEVPFDYAGLGVWNRITKKYTSLEDWINEEAVKAASDHGEQAA